MAKMYTLLDDMILLSHKNSYRLCVGSKLVCKQQETEHTSTEHYMTKQKQNVKTT